MDKETYRVYTNKQLAEEMVWLAGERKRVRSLISKGDQSAQVNLSRIDGMWKAACQAWKERFGPGVGFPESVDDIPTGSGSNDSALCGRTDFSDPGFD